MTHVQKVKDWIATKNAQFEVLETDEGFITMVARKNDREVFIAGQIIEYEDDGEQETVLESFTFIDSFCSDLVHVELEIEEYKDGNYINSEFYTMEINDIILSKDVETLGDYEELEEFEEYDDTED